jgi:hypothetical protein
MKLLGLLITLTIGLILTYYIAGDYLTASGGGNPEEMKLEPMRVSKEVMDKFDSKQSDMRQMIDAATGEKKAEDK